MPARSFARLPSGLQYTLRALLPAAVLDTTEDASTPWPRMMHMSWIHIHHDALYSSLKFPTRASMGRIRYSTRRTVTWCGADRRLSAASHPKERDDSRGWSAEVLCCAPETAVVPWCVMWPEGGSATCLRSFVIRMLGNAPPCTSESSALV